jgi:hypothetical protein
MSLYTLEEICDMCDNAVFHTCCGQFCHCTLGLTDNCNYCHGECSSHTNNPENQNSKDK